MPKPCSPGKVLHHVAGVGPRSLSSPLPGRIPKLALERLAFQHHHWVHCGARQSVSTGRPDQGRVMLANGAVTGSNGVTGRTAHGADIVAIETLRDRWIPGCETAHIGKAERSTLRQGVRLLVDSTSRRLFELGLFRLR